MAAAAAHEDKPASSDHPELDTRASRLVQAAQRASEAAKRAYAAGIQTSQDRAQQVSDVVLENSQRAKESSKEFLATVQQKARHHAGRAQEKAGHYAGKAQDRAIEYKGNVSRAIQQSRDGEGENVGFPLSILVWCSTRCGGSKKKKADTTEREMEGDPESSDFLASTADEFAAALDEDADKLEQAVADKEKKNAADSA